MAITNTAGVVVERLAYDPWGKRRFINGTADTLDAITGQTIDRGFTMHEHIDEMGIINMNGRIYDPLIGRFMSADPYIQAPDDLQSHNRYAYVMNNPLNLTYPSGFSWISKAWKKAWKSPIFKAVLGIVVAIVAPYALAWIAPTLFGAGSLATALATGALSGFASTGTLKGALTGAFTAGIMFGVDVVGKDLFGADYGKGLAGGMGKIGLRSAGGCLSSKVGGGSCSDGAKLAGVLATADVLYDNTVGYKANAGPGKNPEKPFYIPDELTGQQPPDSFGNNVTGQNEAGHVCSQGSTCSKLLNNIPFVNATAGAHDFWFNIPGTTLDVTNPIHNISTMLPAAVLSITASLSDPQYGNVLYGRKNNSKKTFTASSIFLPTASLITVDSAMDSIFSRALYNQLRTGAHP